MSVISPLAHVDFSKPRESGTTDRQTDKFANIQFPGGNFFCTYAAEVAFVVNFPLCQTKRDSVRYLLLFSTIDLYLGSPYEEQQTTTLRRIHRDQVMSCNNSRSVCLLRVFSFYKNNNIRKISINMSKITAIDRNAAQHAYYNRFNNRLRKSVGETGGKQKFRFYFLAPATETNSLSFAVDEF